MKYLDEEIRKKLLIEPRKPRSQSLTRRPLSSKKGSNINPNLKQKRSKSVDNVKITRSKSLVSILKKQNSPRNSKHNVKFDSTKEAGHHDSNDDVKENKKMSKLDWIMTVKYKGNKLIPFRRIDEIDKKMIDKKEFDRFKLEYKKQEDLNNPFLDKLEIIDQKSGSMESLRSNKDKKKDDLNDKMYVFECNQWLAKDEGDRRIERILKLSDIIMHKKV